MGDTTDTDTTETDDTTDTDTGDGTTDTDTGDGTTDDLGDAGKKALAAEREARKAAEKAAKDAAAELEELRKAAMSDSEKAVAEAREAGRSEALAAANARIVRAEVMAAATGVLKDPADAIGFLDLDQFTVTDSRDVDAEAIKSAIDSLVKAKPYLSPGPTPPASLPGGSATEPATGSNPNDWLRSALRG